MESNLASVRRRARRAPAAPALSAVVAAVTAALLGAGSASAAPLQEGGNVLKNGTIGYVLTERHWSVYETEGGKTECPQGFNDGPREQFKKLYPEDGAKRTILEAQLKREGEQWHPSAGPEALPYYEAQGRVSYGMNLDGKIGAEDFESPEGETGIDNQLYRTIGCIAAYRESGSVYHFENLFMRTYDDTRILIELSNVDDLTNDDDVTVRTYRGSDGLLTDASGEAFIPGGTQRVDMRWGKDYIFEFKGKIINGVLISDPVDKILFPWGSTFNATGYQIFRGMQFKLALTPERAEGLIAGFVDIEAFNHHLNTHWSTHHQSYGQLSSPSQYRSLRRLADGYPDPETGENTAISSAVSVKFIQVYIQKPEQELVTKK
jgi:hypothetical protein